MVTEPGDGRFGYVALVGRPNVGKSTLMNRILGQKVSIVTRKPQTTRQRIAGIHTTDAGQVVYVDTPGIHAAAKTALNRYMNRVARAALRDVDLVLFLVEAGRWNDEDALVARALADVDVPAFLVLNKVDQVADKPSLLPFVEKLKGRERLGEIFMVSARDGTGVDDLERAVRQALPFSHPFYDPDQLTDRSERFLAAEFVREQLMLRLHQELPYALTVEVEGFEREARKDGELVRIGAVIWVERDSQKQIVIGKGGQVLKQVGRDARLALEDLLDAKVFLRLWVKVRDSWSDNERDLARFGFEEP